MPVPSNFVSQYSLAQGRQSCVRFTYADSAARLADTRTAGPNSMAAEALSSNDIGSIAHQLDTDSFWILVSDVGPVWGNLSDAGAGAMIIFGDYAIGTSTTVRYLHPMGEDDGNAHTTELQVPMPRSGNLRNLRVFASDAGIGAATITYTVRVNGSDTSLLVAMANTATAGSDLVNSEIVAAGDLLSLSAAKTGSVTASQLHIHASMEFSS